MDIFESLENLNVSEECFEDIVGLVEEYINEISLDTARRALEKRCKNTNDFIAGLQQIRKDALNDPNISQEEYDEIYKRGSEGVGKALRDNTNKIHFYEKWRKGYLQRKNK